MEVDGIQRSALVRYGPDARTKPSPLVFVFNGHGFSPETPSEAYLEAYWPEAIAVYPYGAPFSEFGPPVNGFELVPGFGHNRDLDFSMLSWTA